MTDYISFGVEECWVVRPETHTVEMLQPSRSGSQVVAVFDETQTLASLVFQDLTVVVADVFRP